MKKLSLIVVLCIVMSVSVFAQTTPLFDSVYFDNVVAQDGGALTGIVTGRVSVGAVTPSSLKVRVTLNGAGGFAISSAGSLSFNGVWWEFSIPKPSVTAGLYDVTVELIDNVQIFDTQRYYQVNVAGSSSSSGDGVCTVSGGLEDPNTCLQDCGPNGCGAKYCDQFCGAGKGFWSGSACVCNSQQCQAGPVCGDQTCAVGESCRTDCSTEAHCTDGVDNDADGRTDSADSDCGSSPCMVGKPCMLNSDCGSVNGMPIGNCAGGSCLCPNTACGNGVCDAGEDAINCPTDCTVQSCTLERQCDQSVGGPCGDGTGFSDGQLCYCGDSTCRDRGAFCGQGLCEEWLGETSQNCPQDCGPAGCVEGLSCSNDMNCNGGTCGSLGGLCERTRTSCSDDSDCQALNQVCMRDPTGKTFCDGSGSPCEIDADCPAIPNSCLTRFCERTYKSCAGDSDCAVPSGKCVLLPGEPRGMCDNTGAPCRMDSECASVPERCVSPGDKFCGRTSQLCSQESDCPRIPTACHLRPDGLGTCEVNGAQCRSDLDCPSNSDTCNLIGGSCSCPSSCTDVDGDGLNVEGGDCGQIDACPLIAGRADYQGCPVGDKNIVTLHTVSLGSKTTTVVPLEGATVRVFDRNNADFRTVAGSKNPDGSQYGVVYEADAGRVGSCVTDSSGVCFAGESQTGDYLVIVKFVDPETGKIVYVGRPKSPGDFVDTDGDGIVDLATKDFQVIKVFRSGQFVEYRGGSKIVVTGSRLDIIVPESAVWEGDSSVYPFIFSSDSDWSVDVCAQVPSGYEIIGVYDETGSLMPASECTQVFVSGETKVVAFAVEDIGSPEPVLTATLNIAHKGKKIVKKVVASDVRKKTFVERVSQAKAVKASFKASSSDGLRQSSAFVLTGAVVTGAATAPQTSVVLAFAAIACIIALVVVGHKRRE